MKKLKIKLKKNYSDNYIDYPGKGIITDVMVAEVVRKHSHWWERLDWHRMSDYALDAQLYLMGIIDEECIRNVIGTRKKKWFFRDIKY